MHRTPRPGLLVPSLVVMLLVCGSAASAGEQPDAPPRRGQRSHIQSVGEVAAAAASEANHDLGLRLSRASAVLRQQLALTRGAGLVVEDVAAGSRAARAGFLQHDVLVMLDDQLLLLPEQLAALLEAAPADAPMECTVLRGGRKVSVPLAVADAPSTAAAGAGPAVRLRPAASSLSIVGEAGVPPALAPRRGAGGTPARLLRLSHETLLRQDADYHIRLTGGEETRLLVTDSHGRVVFNDSIDTPEARSRMPIVVRQRVEEMERALEQQPARVGRLDVAPIEVR